ncbi:MAG: VOC family protein [Myxococcales bacterium]|nr:VOC family protein [Myxococcales bacterium]MCB9530338.1 VOC family protein [Myxococcales bacterium]
MRRTPEGWPRLALSVYYEDASAAIDWLTAAFGFEVRLVVRGEGGIVEHSELTFGEAVVMVGDDRRQKPFGPRVSSPRGAGGANTQIAMFYVDDVEAHCARARDAGAEISYPPSVTDYGPEYWADKNYQCVDPEGHAWWFCERVRG